MTAFAEMTSAARIARQAAMRPVETWHKMFDRIAERRERARTIPRYTANSDWEADLHRALGCTWPCPECSTARHLWPQVIAELREKGVAPGPASFGMWNDGEPELARAAWCITRHRRPAVVVETGVARGVTSRFVLEALERNHHGHLWSIDLPPTRHPELRSQIGLAVPARLLARWSYIEGSSRMKLPRLLSRIGQVDLFIHDSMHTERNLRFELDCVWAMLSPAGLMVADDIDLNMGFYSFLAAFPDARGLVCQSEPLRPDLRRFDSRGLFGILFRQPRAVAGRDV